jgi:hypothetical protein
LQLAVETAFAKNLLSRIAMTASPCSETVTLTCRPEIKMASAGSLEEHVLIGERVDVFPR